MLRSTRLRFIVVAASSWISASHGSLVAYGAAAPLVVDGRPAAIVALPPEANEHETQAAAVLVEYVEKMSGAKLESAVVAAADVEKFAKEAKSKRLTPVFVGSIVRDRMRKSLPADAPRGAFTLVVAADRISLTGIDEGTTYAALELLEQLGCRWFFPGELGTVVPTQRSLNLAEQTTAQRPSFPSRWFQMPHKDWQALVRCGGDVFVGGHGLPTPKVKFDKQTGEITPAEYADWFALLNGKRSTRQHCLSNPKLLAYVIADVKARRKAGKGPIIGMGPNDGRGFCECENCKALDGGDFDPFSSDPSVTDRYVWFFNQVLKGVEDEYPDTQLAFYLYHTYMRPPVRYELDKRISGALAPIALDRVHGFSNPIAPEKSHAKWLYEEWGKIMPDLYDRGYWSNLACPGFPFVIVDRLRDEIPECHRLGVKGWRVETFPNYGPQFPSMYVAAKLMWNHETDVDALLVDCFEKFFGPAAGPMGEYIVRMDAALRDGDYCTGSSWDMPHFYPPKFRAEMWKLLEAGARAAKGSGPYAERVRMIAETFEMVDAFNKMLAARAEVDFVKAKAELDRLDGVADKLMNYEPVPMLSDGRHSTYLNYMKRFFRPCTEDGYARVTEGNKLVAAAQDEWQFQIDPLNVGESIGLWKPEVTGGGWQTIRTSSNSWSNQGLRYYKGLAWYRQTLDVPADAIGERTFFWCGGVDETAKVWVNGREIGISPGAAFYPFEMDATAAVKPGKNTIVVVVSNAVVNELGTGGIVAPVMLYAPKDGKNAELRNTRDLKPTFP